MALFDIEAYCRAFITALCAEFGANVRYVGLQGSYLRGEANVHSDIDMMVILGALTVAEMDRYRAVLAQLGDDDRACGFICSVEDMRRWNPLEVCQLRHTTKDLYGRLDDLLPAWTREDEVNYVKMSLNNLYHALCHGYIHADRARLEAHLPAHYKSAFFILQNAHFLASGCTEFPLTKAELTERLTGDDRAVMEMLHTLTQGGEVEFDRQFGLLFRWCQGKMASVR